MPHAAPLRPALRSAAHTAPFRPTYPPIPSPHHAALLPKTYPFGFLIPCLFTTPFHLLQPRASCCSCCRPAPLPSPHLTSPAPSYGICLYPFSTIPACRHPRHRTPHTPAHKNKIRSGSARCGTAPDRNPTSRAERLLADQLDAAFDEGRELFAGQHAVRQ